MPCEIRLRASLYRWSFRQITLPDERYERGIRMGRLFVRIGAVLLCMAALFLWVRSVWIKDDWVLRSTQADYELTSENGSLCISADQSEFREPHRTGVAHYRAAPESGPHAAFRDLDEVGPGSRMKDVPNPGSRYVAYMIPAFRLPYWTFLAIAMGPLVVQLWTAKRRSIRRNQGRCLSCGYDLRATKLRCPECGKGVK
jgi:hypothetical protein